MSARLIIAATLAALASAHPLGNFSVNHYTRLTPGTKGVDVVYTLDLAEVPTLDLLREWKLEAASPPALLEAKAREWIGGLEFRSGSTPVMARVERAEVTLTPGSGGLRTMRTVLHIRLSNAVGKLEFEDHNFADKAGWKEIVIDAAPGVALETASHGAREQSDLSKPPQDLRASLTWSNGPASKPVAITAIPQPAPSTASPPASEVKGDFLSTLLGNKNLSLWMVLTGLATAFALGAAHAFTPGHGKTMVAAYLVGSRGTARHAVLLGGMVTFTHTISVFILGLVTLFLAQYVVPAQLIRILELISGLAIVLIGSWLFYKRLRALRAHAHAHRHDHHHHHGPGGHTHHVEGDVTTGSLIALGASGGLVPCPSALVLMLSAIAVGRIAFGLTLLVAFSLGLAVVLTSIGVAVVYAKHLLPDSSKAAHHPFFRLVPVLSAAVIVCVGLLMTLVALGVISPKLAV